MEGRSLGWTVAGDGEPYEIERYYPGRRVTWLRAKTGECLEGRWYVEGPKDDPAICFLYEDSPVPDCWVTTSDGRGLWALSLSNGVEIAVDLGKAHDPPFGCEHVGS